MNDRIDENQDTLQKIFRQLAELASAQHGGQIAPGGESGQWTQFSGIPSQSSHSAFPEISPWNPLTVSNANNHDSFQNGQPQSAYKTNDSLRTPASPLHVRTSQQIYHPWQSDAASSHPAYQRSEHFSRDYSEPSHQSYEPLPPSYNANTSAFQYRQGASNHLDGFNSFDSRNSLSDQRQVFNSSFHGDLEQTNPSLLKFLPPTHFDPVSYSGAQPPSISPSSSNHSRLDECLQTSQYPLASTYSSPQSGSSSVASNASQSPGPLEENLQNFLPHTDRTGLQFSPSFENSVSSLPSPQKKISLSSRSLSHDPSHDTLETPHLERRTSLGLDLGFNIGRQSSISGINVSEATDGHRIYAESFSKWHSFDSPDLDFSQGSDIKQTVQALSEPSSPDPYKPSYSDIAKTPKSTLPVSKQEPFVSENFQRNHSSRIPGKDTKPPRPFVRRTSSVSKFWSRGSTESISDPVKMPTNSRYGLDSFDDGLAGVSNQNNINPEKGRSRKESESNSCRSGGVSGIDISSGMSDQFITPGGDASAHIPEDRIGEKSVQGSKAGSSCSSSSPHPNKVAEEPLFFDPRRIFQNKGANKPKSHSLSTSAKASSARTTSEQDCTVLNNGKPNASACSNKLPTTARKHDYINNDLRDSKLTNQEAAEVSVSSPAGSNDHELLHRQKEARPRPGKRLSGRSSNSGGHRERKKSPDKRSHGNGNGNGNFEYDATRGMFWSHVDMEKIEEWCGRSSDRLKHACRWLLSVTVSLVLHAMAIVISVACLVVRLIFILVGKAWRWVKGKVSRNGDPIDDIPDWSSPEFLKKKVGLEENIVLPSTGDEAMKRLLSCRGKDPYSILGVRADSSDEDIKRYYRKQAVLVHPDKNQEPGAEEAFKVLGTAFEMIGDPVKRKQYDNRAQDEIDAVAMKAFAEMLSKLQAKIQEAANVMPCDNCSGKHRRIPIDRPFYSARFCERCNVKHAAKEGDVWAETSMLGFKWHYYALMEGRVYDITEWMKCHEEFFKHMKANDHAVATRIASGGNKKPRYRSTQEPSVEELINQLFSKASDANARGSSQGNSSQMSGDAGAGMQPGGSSRKTGRRNKKKR